MASVNKVILVGNLGADPETRYLPSGEGVTNIRVATTDRWKDKASGEQKEATEWHRIAFFGRLAEIAGARGREGRGGSRPPARRASPRTSPRPLRPRSPPASSTTWKTTSRSERVR